jgi:hypothetical protein
MFYIIHWTVQNLPQVTTACLYNCGTVFWAVDSTQMCGRVSNNNINPAKGTHFIEDGIYRLWRQWYECFNVFTYGDYVEKCL